MLFEDSYERFKAQLTKEDVNILKGEQADLTLVKIRKLGTSLVFRLLLFLRYLNDIVGNDIESDIREFLRFNFRTMYPEVVT